LVWNTFVAVLLVIVQPLPLVTSVGHADPFDRVNVTVQFRTAVLGCAVAGFTAALSPPVVVAVTCEVPATPLTQTPWLVVTVTVVAVQLADVVLKTFVAVLPSIVQPLAEVTSLGQA
jgi:hypothetical protein